MIYTYEKQINLDKLTNEIRSSSITIALSHIEYLPDSFTVNIHFKLELSVTELGILDTIIDIHDPSLTEVVQSPILVETSNPKTAEGFQKVAMYEPEGASATVATHDFCDKTTWYSMSVQVTEEILVLDSEDFKIFKSDNKFWIDLTHSKVYDEDNIVSNDNSFVPKIWSDNVLLVEGVDYVIDYSEGIVTFNNSQENKEIKASYRYATTSYYRLIPKSGKVIKIKTSEIQFGSDSKVSSPIVFEAWVEYMPGLFVPVPGSRIAYKNEKDLMTACNEGQGIIPAWGNYNKNVYVFPFHYARPKPIKSSQKVEIRVYTADHTPLEGTYATGTFYITIEDEREG